MRYNTATPALLSSSRSQTISCPLRKISRQPFDERVRIILLRNTSSLRSSKNKEDQSEPIYYSSLVGMEVNKQRRGEGLSKVFVAIWLRLCLDTHTYPRAAVMNKPLIAHVLMKFGFLPQNGGSRVELIRLNSSTDNILNGDKDGYSPKFALYSTSAKSLQGLFSEPEYCCVRSPPSAYISKE